MVSNQLGPIEPPASGPSRFSVCRQECVGPRHGQHTPAGGRQWPLSRFGVFDLEVPSQETKGLVCSICYPGDMGNA